MKIITNSCVSFKELFPIGALIKHQPSGKVGEVIAHDSCQNSSRCDKCPTDGMCVRVRGVTEGGSSFSTGWCWSLFPPFTLRDVL